MLGGKCRAGGFDHRLFAFCYHNGMTCSVENCSQPAIAKGFCRPHYRRNWQYGDPTRERPRGRRWKGGGGYEMQCLVGHPLANARGEVSTHRVVLYDAIGPGPHPCTDCGQPVEWGVDLITNHLDEDILNNDLNNLAPVCDQCNVLHSALIRRDARRKEHSWTSA